MGLEGGVIGIDTVGKSAPSEVLFEHVDLIKPRVVEAVIACRGRQAV